MGAKESKQKGNSLFFQARTQNARDPVSLWEMQGWLKKGRHRRFAVIEGNSIAWFKDSLHSGGPKGRAQRSVCLHKYKIEANEATKAIRLAPSERHETERGAKSFTFIVPEGQDAAAQLDSWVRSLKEHKNKSHDGEGAVGGWMGKKGKHRWFVFKGGVLSWYNKEQSPTSAYVGVGPSCVQSNGFLPLGSGGFSLSRGKNARDFTLKSKDQDYTMNCEAEGDFQFWWKQIDAALNPSRTHIAGGTVSTPLPATGAAPGFAAGAQPPGHAASAAGTFPSKPPGRIDTPDHTYGNVSQIRAPANPEQSGTRHSGQPQMIPVSNYPRGMPNPQGSAGGMPNPGGAQPKPDLLQRRLNEFVPGHGQQQKPDTGSVRVYDTLPLTDADIATPNEEDGDDPGVVVYGNLDDLVDKAADSFNIPAPDPSVRRSQAVIYADLSEFADAPETEE